MAPGPAAAAPIRFKFGQEDAEARAEEAFPSGTWSGLGDANWKLRLEAITTLYEWLEKGGTGEIEAELVVRGLCKKPGWKESNFQVGGKMFNTFQLLAEKSQSWTKGSAALSIAGMSEKLGDMKLKKPAGEALTAFAEQSSLGFVLGQAYETMGKQKAPKALADSMLWVDSALREFGIQGLAVRELIEFLKLGLKSANAAVRTNATKTLVTLKQFIGSSITSFLQDLNPQLLATIESEFAKVDGEAPPDPTRTQRDLAPAAPPPAAAAPAAANGAGGGGGGAPAPRAGKGKAAAADEYDPMDELFPRVDFDKLVSPATITALGDANWKVRKEALDTIQSTLEANKRLKPSGLNEIATPLKLRVNDSNKIIQGVALDIVARLATGMGRPFAQHARFFSAPVATVLADQKVTVRAAAAKALTAMADVAGLDPLLPGFDKPLEGANPLLRKDLLAWLEERFADEDEIAGIDCTPIAGPVLMCLEDRGGDVRKSAAAILPVIVARAGYSFVMEQAGKMKPASKATVTPLIDAARSKAPAGGAAARAPPPAAAKPPPPPPAAAAPPAARAPAPKPAAAPPARLAAKPPPAAAAAAPPPARKPAAAPAGGGAPRPVAGAKANEPVKFKFGQEDAEARAEEAFPAGVWAGLADANWKLRLEAVTNLYEWLEKGATAEIEAELVVRGLCKKPGWKESNFQVGGKMFNTFQLLAEKSPSFTKGSAALSIPGMSEKLGDMKLKKPAGEALTAFAEQSSLGFVLGQAYETMGKQKAPKALADSMLWVDAALREFGITGLAVRELIEFLKLGLKSANAAVRTNATKTLVTLKLYIGSSITSFLQDLNPQLLATIESEFAKVDGESPPEATRTQGDWVVPAAPVAAASDAGPAAAAPKAGKGRAAVDDYDPLDELFPRVDFDKLVSSTIITSLGDSNWKVRKEALDNIQSILENNKRLKPSGLTELATPLKMRVNDSNKIIQTVALDIVAKLASGMGRPFAQHSRFFSGPVATVLADQKVTIRAAGAAALTAMADGTGLDSLLPGFDKPLEGANPLLRKDLLAWLEVRFADEDEVAGIDCTPIAGPVLMCLEDRGGDVRKSAAAILPVIVARAGYGFVMEQAGKMKPASKATVTPLIEAAKGKAPAAAAPPPRAPPAAKAPAPARAAPPQAPAAPAAAPPSRPASAASSTTRTSAPAAARGVHKSLARPGSAAPASSYSAQPVEEAPPPRASSIRPRASIIGKSRPGGVSAPPSKAAAPVGSSEAPFKNSDGQPKLLRASKETGSLRWVVEGAPRQDQIDSLMHQMTPHTSPELFALLFSADHNAERDFIAGLAQLDECAKDSDAAAERFGLDGGELRARLVANVDVMFKYVTLRLGLSNTTIVVRCLDVIEHLIAVLDQAGCKLSDYEANALLISLIAKVGDPKETIRDRIRAIFKAICSIYPYSKVFTTILDHGLDSKNVRTREQSASELGALFQRHGVASFNLAKCLPLLGKMISDKDASVRTAALLAIGAAYTIVGLDVINKNVGRLPDKERSMLDERLKRTAGGAASAIPPSPNPNRSATPVQRIATPSRRAPSGTTAPSSPTGSASGEAPRSALRAPTSRMGLRPPSVYGTSSLSADGAAAPVAAATGARKSLIGRPQSMMLPPGSRLSAASSLRAPSNPHAIAEDDHSAGNGLSQSRADVRALIAAVVSSDVAQCADNLKRVQAEITSQPELLVPEADQLILAIKDKMAVGFGDLSATSTQATLRLCKHLMQTLSSYFDHKSLGQAVSASVLTDLLAELTARLLDTAENPPTEAISSLSKVLNMVLIRIFHHADQTACFSALFAVLTEATADMRELRGAELADRAKYAELVMKCLWKVSKTVKESLEDQLLSGPRLLADINRFLVATPPAEWRRRSTDNVPLGDMPLRTVKTILQQIVSVYGQGVFEQLDEIDQAENSFVYQYLYRLASAAPGSTASDKATVGAPTARARQPSVDDLGSGSRPQSMLRQASTSSAASSVRQSISAVSSPMLARVASTSSNGSNGSASAAPPAGVMASPGGADIEMNQRLKEIFDLIGDPTQSRAGIEQLYLYQKENPAASPRIQIWMSKTGNYFQTYLKRALDNLRSLDQEKNGAAPPQPAAVSGGADEPRSRSASGNNTPTRPISVMGGVGVGAAPGSPRTVSARHSVLGSPSLSGSAGNRESVMVSAESAAKLQALQAAFGYNKE